MTSLKHINEGNYTKQSQRKIFIFLIEFNFDTLLFEKRNNNYVRL